MILISGTIDVDHPVVVSNSLTSFFSFTLFNSYGLQKQSSLTLETPKASDQIRSLWQSKIQTYLSYS